MALYLVKSETALQAGLSQFSARITGIRAAYILDSGFGDHRTVSDSLGRYRFENVPQAEYDLVAVKDAQTQAIVTGVKVNSKLWFTFREPNS